MSRRFFESARQGILVTALMASLLVPLITLAVITNGSNAVDMFGQFDDTLSDPQPQYNKQLVGFSRANDGPNKLGLYYPHSVALDPTDHRLYVADSDNHRVLVYDLDGSNALVDHIPDYVIGQSDFASGRNNDGQDRFDRPYGMVFDDNNGYLFVSDEQNSRVLAFDRSGLSDGMSASYVLGQQNFTDDGTGTGDTEMAFPTGLAVDSTNNRLYVADTGNNRVLMFELASIGDGMAASNVIGQTGFGLSGTGLSDSTFDSPYGLAYGTNDRLYVADADNNRVLVFDISSVSNGMSAVSVVGQANFTSNGGATTQAGLFFPRGLAYDDTNGRLFVASGSHRVTVYNMTSFTDGDPAIAVLGQSNYTNSNQVTTQSGFRGTSQITYDSGNQYLYVVDQFNHRVLQFDVNVIGNGENATNVIGQYDSSLTSPAPLYTKGYPDNGPSKLGFWGTQGGSAIDTVNHRLFASDTFNNRILIFNLNSSNQLIERIPDYVIGQTNFVSSGVTVTSTGLNKPRGMVMDQANTRLFVADSLNNRVLMYSVGSVSDGMAATRVLGQANFTSSGVNVTQAGLGRPIGLTYRASDQTLFVGDRLNHRVVTYDVNTVTNGENAVNVLGQTDFITATTGTTQSKFNLPYGLAYDASGTTLFVSELTNNRILSFDVSSITDGEPAQHVLGQTLFTTSTPRTTSGGLRDPAGLSFDSGHQRLFVGDSSNNRVLEYLVDAISNGEGATHVLGQSTFTASGSSVAQSAIYQPFGIYYDPINKYLYANENSNYRITIFDAEASSSSTSSSSSSSVASSSSSSGGGTTGTSGGGGSTGGGTQAGGTRFRYGTPTFNNDRTYGTKITACVADLADVPMAKTGEGWVEALIKGTLVRFTDVQGDSWYGRFVSFVLSKELAGGYNGPDGKPLGLFRPERPVTHVEFAKMLLRTVGEQPSKNSPKNRSALASWGKGEVARAEELGWTVFTPGLDVNTPITRGAVLQSIVEALKLPLTTLAPVYGDLKADHPYAKAIATALQSCIISGDTAADGSLLPRVRPDDTLNRAELSKILTTLWALQLTH